MVKYIIKGVTGFIGKSLAERLLAEKNIVIGIGRNSKKLNELFKGEQNFIPIHYEQIEENMKYLNNVSVFFDASWDGYEKSANDFKVQFNNINEVYSGLLLASRINCIKYIFFNSSAAVEKDKLTNEYCSVYGAAKSAAERLARVVCNKNKIDYNSIIFPNIHGKNDCSKRSVNILINNLIHNQPLNLVHGTDLNDWVYIDDAVQGIITVSEKGISGREYYIGHRELSTLKDIIISSKMILSSDSELRFGTYPDNSYIDFSEINLTQLYKDTGFECKCDFKESILKTAKWVKQMNSRGLL